MIAFSLNGGTLGMYGGEKQLDYLLRFVTYGLIELMKEWFDQDIRLPKADLIAAAEWLING